MNCPKCKQGETQVLDSRVCVEAVRRRRHCLLCSFRFTTFERLELPKLFIIKKDGRREIYNSEKIKTGIQKACEKRPISQNNILKVAHEIEREIFETNISEIKSSTIGELVMSKLKNLDKIAYIRFASVYRSFENLNQFEKEIDNIQ